MYLVLKNYLIKLNQKQSTFNKCILLYYTLLWYILNKLSVNFIKIFIIFYT